MTQRHRTRTWILLTAPLWLAACAAGLPAGRWPAETTVCRLVIAAAILATVRYATLLAAWLRVA